MPGQLDAFRTLTAAGREVRLVIDPWTHESFGITGHILREGFDWLDRFLKSDGGHAGEGQLPLRLFVMGRQKWIDLAGWPPPAEFQRWHLHGDASLARPAPADALPRRYTYDPTRPTPALGGGATIVGHTSGAKNQRERERRADVLTYTSETLTQALTVVGPLAATLYIRADGEYLDLFVRLCDVTPPLGWSYNVSDGIVRLRPSDFAQNTDGALAVRLFLWSTATTFKAGHRLRLQVSSAAHPMYARNLGIGEALASGTQTKPIHIEVLNDPSHPSAIEIPVVQL